MVAVLVLSVAVLAYVYVGYPMLLRLVVRLRGARSVRKADITPSLSLVISAYNEAQVIRRKLENAVALRYPRDAFEIVVVSDASNDGTDDIVREFADRGVKLARQAERRGKTAGLNRTVPTLAGDIVVFSDANAMYELDALLMLARNFADPGVGCVTGEARYLPRGVESVADAGERAYWDYEIQIKRSETAIGSMVGGDGAIYAIRRSLWRELPENAINDFLNPLQIVAAGWRAVYEPAAICYEETAGAVQSEYRRRVRIVSRSWRAVFQAPGVLNPLRVGLFTWSLVSHKMLRWLSGVFVVLAIVSAIFNLVQTAALAPATTLLLAAGIAVALASIPQGRRSVAMLGYFATIYLASAVGVLKGSLGNVSGTWSTPRQHKPPVTTRPILVPVGALLQLVLLAMLVGAVALWRVVSPQDASRIVFWASVGILAYIYVGYPVLLAGVRLVASRAVRRQAMEPGVCIFITANDEDAVIEDKLRNTLALDYPTNRLGVIVASDGSVDRTNEIVRGFAPRVQLLELRPRRGKIAAINEGMQRVTSDIVIFSDANTFLQPDAIRALVRNFADAHVGAVSGDVVLTGERASLAQSEDLYYRYERWMQRAESDIGSMIGADGALYAIRRELFVPQAADTILDDMAIPMEVVKSGRRVVFDGDARATEQGSETATEEFARKVRVTAGAVQFIRRPASAVPITSPQVIFSLLSHKALRWFSPAFAASAFVSSVVLAGEGVVYAAAVASEAAVLALALLGCVPHIRRLGLVGIAHYFCLLQAAAAVGFFRGLAGRQSVLWERFDRSRAAIADGAQS